jgi:L-ribulokinase
MTAAVAAGPSVGGHATLEDATRAMARRAPTRYDPSPEGHAVYSDLYADYMRLHDLFGRGELDVMPRLRELRAHAVANRG